MKRPASYALLTFILAAPTLVATPPSVKKEPAESRLITLEAPTPQRFLASSNSGFILIALGDSSLLVNGHAMTLSAGQSHQVTGSHALDILNTSALSARLVLVKINTAFQPLTISQEELPPHQTLEDASDSNETLVVALAPLALRDVRDLCTEGEPWRSSAPRTISLHEGQSAWLRPGMHRIRNLGSAHARFISIEW